MDNGYSCFPQAHRALLTLLEESRALSLCSASDMVRERLHLFLNQFIDCADEATRTAFQNYLEFFAKRFSDPSICVKFTLDDPKVYEAILAKDPSRYDQSLLLARSLLRRKRYSEARLLLQKIAASGFFESKEAKRLLEQLIDESLN